MAQYGTQDDGHDPVQPHSRELQEALDWFIYLEGRDASAAEKAAFRAWYDGDARRRAAYARVVASWNAPELTRAARAVEGLGEPRERGPRRRLGRRAFAVCAVLALAVIGVDATANLLLHLQADHMTATGEQQEIALADGSSVLLDSASAIRTRAKGDSQEVELLAGRAFFDIDPARERQFKVITDQAVIEVAGTQFAVGYKADRTTVTLHNGRLRVGRRVAAETTRQLAAGQRITVDAASLSPPHSVRFSLSNSWVGGRLVFRDRTLSSLLDELRRYHAGTILLIDPALGDVRLSGNYRLDDHARVVEQLAKLASAEVFRLTDRVLVIH